VSKSDYARYLLRAHSFCRNYFLSSLFFTSQIREYQSPRVSLALGEFVAIDTATIADRVAARDERRERRAIADDVSPSCLLPPAFVVFYTYHRPCTKLHCWAFEIFTSVSIDRLEPSFGDRVASRKNSKSLNRNQWNFTDFSAIFITISISDICTVFQW